MTYAQYGLVDSRQPFEIRKQPIGAFWLAKIIDMFLIVYILIEGKLFITRNSNRNQILWRLVLYSEWEKMVSYGVRNALLCMIVTFSSICNVGVLSYALLGNSKVTKEKENFRYGWKKWHCQVQYICERNLSDRVRQYFDYNVLDSFKFHQQKNELVRAKGSNVFWLIECRRNFTVTWIYNWLNPHLRDKLVNFRDPTLWDILVQWLLVWLCCSKTAVLSLASRYLLSYPEQWILYFPSQLCSLNFTALYYANFCLEFFKVSTTYCISSLYCFRSCNVADCSTYKALV